MSKLKHVTEHDGSRWVELEVAEEMYAMLEALLADGEVKIPSWKALSMSMLLTKARGESK